MQKPNVLLISSWYPSREHPTLGNFVQRHAEAINPFVNLYVLYVTSSEVISANNSFDIENNVINGVNTTIVYYKKVTSRLPLLSSRNKYNLYKSGYELGFNEIVKRFRIEKFDICHCNVTFPAGLIALNFKKKFNLPYILTEHWTLFLSYKDDFEKLPFYVINKMKKITSNAEFVFPVSKHLAMSMQFKGLNGKYGVIPNVVDTERFGLKTESNREIKRILHVSTLVDGHKNISGIYRVLKNISNSRQDFKLIIVSDGDIESAKKLQNAIGLQEEFVEYHNTKTPDEIAKFYQNSDFFLLFSNYENLPVVISESLSCGLPVVSSNVGGIPEMIDNSGGLLVNPKKDQELELAINSMLDNLTNYSAKEIRKGAVLRYNKERVGNRYFEIYKEIIG